MNSIVFQTSARVLLPVLLLLSVIVLFRGHNDPGGGFVGGLLAASAFTLYGLAFGARAARSVMRISPIGLIGLGMNAAVLSAVPALLAGEALMTGLWFSVPVWGYTDPIKIGTPVVFDIGVYLVVIGGTTLMALTLEEFRHDASAGA